jgi:hypothetical protein
LVTEPAVAIASTALRAGLGSAGPVSDQEPPASAKMPGADVRSQAPATIGVPCAVNATAVSRVSPQVRPAWLAAICRSVASVVHAACDWLWTATVPLLVSAISRPAGPAASASGSLASPNMTGEPADQEPPLSVLVATGENVRSWLGRKPAATELAPVTAATTPPLLATPAGVASRQAADPAARAKSCQKFSWSAADPPMSTTA